jgi:colanic acid biosynthesis protein WcaH
MMDYKGRLPLDVYTTACSMTQIIAIDLIVHNKLGQILLGMRKNPPAQNTYFTPGGRAFKFESLNDAFARTIRDELGIDFRQRIAGQSPAHESSSQTADSHSKAVFVESSFAARKLSSTPALLGENLPESLDFKLHGVYDHMYPNECPTPNVKGISTHYVVFAFDVYLGNTDIIPKTFENQHSEAVWMLPEEILESVSVHEITKRYFERDAPNRFKAIQ